MPPTGSLRGSNRNLLAELREMIGDPATLQLIERFGGARIHVAERDTETLGLDELIGPVAADRMRRVWGRCELSVPLAKAWRAHTYIDQFGLTPNDVAGKLCMTRSGVARMAGRAIDAPPFDPSSTGADPI